MKKRILIPATLFLLAFVLITLSYGFLSPLNRAFRAFIGAHLPMSFYPVAMILHYSFETVLGTLQTLAWAAILLFIYKSRPGAVLLAATLLFQSAAVNVIKALTAVPRPPQEFFGVLHHNFSFPSGHTCTSATFAIMLGYLLICVLKRKEGIPVTLAYSIVALVTAYSRMYLDVHWILDIAGGLSFAGFVSLSAIALDRYIRNRKPAADYIKD